MKTPERKDQRKVKPSTMAKEDMPAFKKMKRDYGKIIREYRQKAGLEQAQLSSMFGYSKNAVSNWENGNSRPDLDVITDLCSYLHIPLGVFFGLPTDATAPLDELEVMRYYRSLNKYNKRTARQILKTLSENEKRELLDAEKKSKFIRLADAQLPASAGTGMALDGIAEPEYIYVRTSQNARQADEIITVSGDSMFPTFRNGDRVFVQHTSELGAGDIGIFVVAGEGFVKEYQQDGLRSHNPKYSMIHPTEDDYVRCVGRVLGIVDPDQLATPEESVILDELFAEEEDK